MVSQAIQHIEGLLRARSLDGTLARPELVPATASTGLTSLDEALGGGWRRGELSELAGPVSSGRTSVLVSTMAAATGRGEVVGLIDSIDRFDPAMAAAAGVDVTRVLWVRGPSVSAITERPSASSATSSADAIVRRALRAADLIVRAGGFGVVALDLADLPVATLRRVPASSWLRLAHANEGRDTVCLLVADAPMARSPRGWSVRLTARARWTGTSAQRRRLDGLDVHASVTSAREMGNAQVRL
jgi:recombination protein RecA